MTKPPRIEIVDALRGFALAGVAIVHFAEQYLAGRPPEGFMEGVNSLPDHIVNGLIQIFITGKFFALFSVLFGLSFSIQMKSAERRGDNFPVRFLWRAILLLVIGYVHQLFYRGDILTIYAMVSLLFIPFYKVSNKWILITAGIIFLGLPRFISYAVWANGSIFGLQPMIAGVSEAELSYFNAAKAGTFLDVASLNAFYGMLTKMDFQLLFFGRFYYTLGYFLIGLWLGRIGLLERLTENRQRLIRALQYSGGGIVLAFILTAAFFSSSPQPVDFGHWLHVLGINSFDWVNVVMTVLIFCTFLLIYEKKFWFKKLQFFAPYGRMALTNYIIQAIFGTFLLFGWGCGLLGQVRTLWLVLIAIGFIGFQVFLSRIWLKHFYYGPLEWLWRCGTYFKIYPLRKHPQIHEVKSTQQA